MTTPAPRPVVAENTARNLALTAITHAERASQQAREALRYAESVLRSAREAVTQAEASEAAIKAALIPTLNT